MADEKERITHYDERESELQNSKEIQNLSEEVMQLIQQEDEEAPPLLDRTASLPMQVRVPPSPLLGTQSQLLSGESEPVLLGVGQRMFLTADPDEELNAAKRQAVNDADSTTSESALQPGAYRVSQGVARQQSSSMADISSQEFTTQGDDELKETDDSPDENSTSDGALQNQDEEKEGEDLGNLPPTLHSSQDQIEESTEASIRSVGESSLTVVAVRVDPGEAEQLAIRRILDEAVQADVVAQESPAESAKWWSNKKCRLVVVAAFLSVVGLVVGLSVGLTQNVAGNTGENDPSQEQSPFQPTLQTVRERDVLLCGSPDVFYHINFDPETGERVGFEIDMCRSFAAGIFGNESKYEVVDIPLHERFTALAAGDIDLYFRAAPTMGRDVIEQSSGVGFSFSVPFLHGGVAFGGKEFFVQCADDLNTFGECSALKVCTAPGTTHMEIVEQILPSSHILRLSADEIIVAFVEGRCNVIVAEVWDLAIVLIEQDTFGTGHSVGKEITHESISIVTRDNDPEWSDMVNWMLQSLFEAEKQGITQATAADFKNTSAFGEEYKHIFQNIIGAHGNYGELYDRHLASTLARSGMNLLNAEYNTGILRTPALDGTLNSGPEAIPGGELEGLSSKGYLICGITEERPGFAEFNVSTEEWSGLDVDFCRVVASAVFFGSVSNETIRFIQIDDMELGFEALVDNSVDILCGQRVTLGADISGYGSGEGAAFSLPYYYDGGDQNRALAVRQSDAQWSSFVYWTVACTIHAEVKDIVQATSNRMPEVRLFGSRYNRMFRDAILVVGNYGEMYSRNLESLIPRSGLNLLNVYAPDAPVGPQYFPLPFDEIAQ